MTNDTFFSMSLSCDFLAVTVGVGGKGVEHEICIKTLCTERSHILCLGHLQIDRLMCAGTDKQTSQLTESDNRMMPRDHEIPLIGCEKSNTDVLEITVIKVLSSFFKFS